jgi:hypothetical protein
LIAAIIYYRVLFLRVSRSCEPMKSRSFAAVDILESCA